MGEKKKEVNESVPNSTIKKTHIDQNLNHISPFESNGQKLPEKISDQETEKELMKEMHDRVIKDLQETKPGESILKKSPVRNKINKEGDEKTTRLKFDEEVLVRPHRSRKYDQILLEKLKETKDENRTLHDAIFEEAFESITESERKEAFKFYNNGANFIQKLKSFDLFEEAFESITESERKEAFKFYNNHENDHEKDKNGANFIQKLKSFDLLLPILKKFNNNKYQELINEYVIKDLEEVDDWQEKLNNEGRDFFSVFHENYKLEKDQNGKYFLSKEDLSKFQENALKQEQSLSGNQMLLNKYEKYYHLQLETKISRCHEETFCREMINFTIILDQEELLNKKFYLYKQILEDSDFDIKSLSEIDSEYKKIFGKRSLDSYKLKSNEITKSLLNEKNQPFLDKIIEFFDHLKNFKNLKDNLEFFNSNLNDLKKAFKNDGYDFDSQKTKDGIQNLRNIFNEYNSKYNDLIKNLKNDKNILKKEENKIILYDYNINDNIELKERSDYKNLLQITEKQRELLEQAQKEIIDLNLPISLFARNDRCVRGYLDISNKFILEQITGEQEQKNPNPNPK